MNKLKKIKIGVYSPIFIVDPSEATIEARIVYVTSIFKKKKKIITYKPEWLFRQH